MPSSPADSNALNQCYRDLLGYLNFSDGTPGNRFRECLNELFASDVLPLDLSEIGNHLLAQLAELSSSGESAFAQADQAQKVIRAAFSHVLPNYGKIRINTLSKPFKN